MRIRWQIASVETAGQATWPSLAFSPSGQAAIAFHSSLNNALRFATLNADGTWAISTVDAVFSDCKPSLAFRFGRPAISYRVGQTDLTGQLRYALFTGGSPPWSINSVAPSAIGSSLAFDSFHRAGISYYDPSSKALKFAREGPSPTIWISQTVDPPENAPDPKPDIGDFNALAFTPLSGAPYGSPGDLPAIAYHDQTHNQIKYARFDGTAWHLQTVRPGIGWCSLDFGPAGGAAIGYSERTFVGYAHFDTSIGWWGGGILGGITGSLAYSTSSSRPWDRGIAYTNAHIVLAYGHYSAPLGYSLVEKAGKNQLGQFIGPFELPALAFSPSGQPAITYYDSANSTIKYAAGTIVRMPLDALDDLFEFLRSRLLRLRP
jgi:hypothetical protein